MVQWLRVWVSTARGRVSIPGQGTKILHASWPRKKKKSWIGNGLFLWIFLNWRMIALLYCIGFCHESAIGIPMSPPSDPPSRLPPQPTPLGQRNMRSQPSLFPLLIWHCFPWSEHNHAARGPGACWSRARGLLSGHREGGRKVEVGFGGWTKDKPVNCFSEIQKYHVGSEK